MPAPPSLFRRISGILHLTLMLLLAVGCVYYLISSPATIRQQYQSIGGCYYRMSHPEFKVLSPGIVHMGYYFCGITLLLLPVYWLLWRKCRTNPRHFFRQPLSLFRQHRILFAGITAMLLLPQFYWLCTEPFSTDEVFSVLNFSGRPLLYTLTQYQFPNNHVGFNILAHFLPGTLTQRIYEARALALLCYTAHAWLLLAILLRHIKSSTLAFWATLAGMMVFMVAGFGHQARGYSLLYLLGLTATYSLYRICGRERRDDHWYSLLTIANIAGLFVAPSFLYVIGFELCYALIAALRHRPPSILLMRSWLLSGMGAWFAYMPLLCVSGMHALSGNKYVQAATEGRSKLLAGMADYFGCYITENAVSLPSFYWSLLLILSGGLCGVWLYYRKQITTTPLAVLASHVFSVTAVSWLLGHLPYARILGLQMQLLLLCCICSIWLALQHISKKAATQNLLTGISAVALVLSMGIYYHTWSGRRLYDQDTQAHARTILERVRQFPKGSTVWLSEESFMWAAFEAGHIQTQYMPCHFAQQSFLVFSDNEDGQMSPDFIRSYHPIDTAGSYRIWQRNQ